MIFQTQWLDGVAMDVRQAVRSLWRRPGFAAIAVLILALGIGATTIMFTVVNGVLLRPLPYPEPDRLLTVRRAVPGFGEVWGFSNPDRTDLQRASRTLSLAAWTYGGGTITGSASPEYVDGRLISAELFPMLGMRLEQGRAFRPDEDKPGGAPVAIISHALWLRRYGGSASAIGMPLMLDGKSYTVIGVTPAGFQLDVEADVFTPLGQSTEPRMQNRGANFIHVWARLRPGVAPTAAQAELAVIGRQLAVQYPTTDAGVGVLAHPLQRELVGDIRPTLWLLLAAVSLVLVIACVNIASLLLARAVSRDRELAMRVALGASRGRLARQCLTESAVLGVFGGGLGVLIASVGVRPFAVFWPGGLPRVNDVRLDWPVLLFALAVSLASGLVAGLAPALRAPVGGGALGTTLRAGGRGVAGGTRRLHGLFVISEIALALVLLVSAGMLGRTLLSLASLDPGVNVHNVLTARFAISPAALRDTTAIRVAWQDVLDRARHVRGVESAALADIVPMREGENTLSYWATPTPPPPDQTPVTLASSVTPDYLHVMGIPLRAGRFLDAHDSTGTELVIVIDENLARHAFGGAADAVGKRLWVPSISPDPVRIVGVVGHVRHWGLANDDQSRVHDQIYYPFAQVPASLLHFFSSVMSIVVRTNIPPATAVAPLRQGLRGASGDQALYDARTMEDLVSASLDRQRFLASVFGVFAGLAVVLACIGIYGVLAYLTNQRVPEIGVRMALGASGGDVLRAVMRESLGMILIGASIGLLAALATGRILNRLVVGMRPNEPVTVLAMIAVLVVAALFASYLPARWASRLDPISALRQD